MKHKSNIFEAVVHGIFLILGLITVGCVLLITIYLIISGIPAIRQIGLFHFLFGKKWASTAARAGIRHSPLHSHQRLRHRRGYHHRRAHRIPDGGVSGENGAKAPSNALWSRQSSMLAGIPSVVYGLVGMMVLVPGTAEALPHSRRRQPARRHHRPGCDDPALHYQNVRHRTGSGAEGIRGRFPGAGRDA